MDKSRLVRFVAGGNSYIFPTIHEWHDNFKNPAVRLQALPGMSGGFDPHGNRPGPNEPGVVQCSFTIQSGTRAGMTAYVDAMGEMVDWGKGLLFAQPADSSEAERFTIAKVHNVDDPNREDDHSDLWHDVQLTLACELPLWFGLDSGWPLWDIAEWDDPWGADPVACSGLETLFTVTNDGNAETLARVTIICGTGQTATNPTVQRYSPGGTLDQVKYTGTLTAGDVVVIDPPSHKVTLNDASAYNGTFQSNVLHPDWMRIKPGSNSIRVALGNLGDACSVAIDFYDSWRTV